MFQWMICVWDAVHVNKGRIHYIRNYLFDFWKRLPSKQCCKYHTLLFISTGLLIQWKRNHNESFCRMWSVILKVSIKETTYQSRLLTRRTMYLWHPYKVWTLTKSNYLLSNRCWIISVIYNTSYVHLLLPQPIFRCALAAAFKVTHREIVNLANWFSSSYMMLEAWWEGVEYYLMSAGIHSMYLFGNPIMDDIVFNCCGLHILNLMILCIQLE